MVDLSRYRDEPIARLFATDGLGCATDRPEPGASGLSFSGGARCFCATNSRQAQSTSLKTTANDSGQAAPRLSNASKSRLSDCTA